MFAVKTGRLYLSLATISILTTSGFAGEKIEIDQADFQNINSKLVELETELKKLKSSQTTSVINKKSPNFILGQNTNPNFKIKAEDSGDMYIKLGARVQGTFEHKNIDSGDSEESFNDAYLRRVRFEATVGFDKYTSFTMDIRNDKANYEDKGEQEFNIGDAYLKIKKPFDTSLVNFKLYRGKIDVSRTETVKSAFTIHYDRPHVADEAAQFITHNRRGTNMQMYGDWNKKFHYQVAVGDGVYSGKLKDSRGKSFEGDLTQENFFYGGKVILSPFDGWEEKSRTETYFGQGQHLSLGLGYWKSPDINIEHGDISQTIDHTLLNLELSAHYKNAFVEAEYFSFDGVVNEWGDDKTGKSDGWYVTGEYLFDNLGNIAPFARYEEWNKWENEDGYDLTSTIVGLNWYLRGYTTKVGFAVQNDEYGKNIGDKEEQRIKLTSQWFF